MNTAYMCQIYLHLGDELVNASLLTEITLKCFFDSVCY